MTAAPPFGAQLAPGLLAPGITEAAAFRAIVAGGLGALQASHAPALATDPEGVHQMRVALRRLRTTLALFAPHLDAAAEAGMNDRLGSLGRIAGEARDWDVFVEQTLPAAFSAPDRQGARVLLASRATPLRAAAHARLAQTLQGQVPAALIDDLLTWSHAPDVLHAIIPGAPFAAHAPRLLDRLSRKVRRRARHIGHADADALHDLRKSLKKLRYAAEFAAGLYDPARVKSTMKTYRRLQERLGRINDAAAADSLAARLADPDPQVAAALAELAAWSARRARHARRALPRDCDRLHDAHPFWHAAPK